jgi:DNA-directed RNA polymerase sigma subunit (sigma70/sigma32)
MIARTDIPGGDAAPKRRRKVTGDKHAVSDVAQPAFELTAEEMVLAKRIFTARRRMDEYATHEVIRCSIHVMEEMAKKYPRRNVPGLRLVKGGAA